MNPKAYWQERKKMTSPDEALVKLPIEGWLDFIEHRKDLLATMSMNDALDLLLEADERMAAYPAMIETVQRHFYDYMHHNIPLPEKTRALLFSNKIDKKDYLEEVYVSLERQKQRIQEWVVNFRYHLAQANAEAAFDIMYYWNDEVYRAWEGLLLFKDKFNEVLPSPIHYFAEKNMFAPAIVVDDQLLQKIARHLKTVANPWKKYANES